MYRIAFVILILTILPGCEAYKFYKYYLGPSCYDVRISPNEFEWSYYAISVETGMSELCFKMSPKAFLTAGLSPAGHQISYTRSDCFYEVALKSKNRELCEHVITFETNACIDGSKISKDECLKDISQNKKGNGPEPNAELILRYLGYNDTDIEKLKYDDEKDFFNLYLKVRKSSDFKNKLELLPDFSSSDQEAIEQIKFLHPQCKSNDYEDPLCSRINCGLVRDAEKDPKCYSQK